MIEKYTKGGSYLYCTFTGKYDKYGFKIFLLQFVNSQHTVVDQLEVVSGSPAAQKRPLLHPKDDRAGSGNPCPEGIYQIGKVIEMKVPEAGVGYFKIPLEVLSDFDVNDRCEILLHEDFNAAIARGTMGCYGTYNLLGMKRIVSWCSQKASPTVLIVDYGKGLLASRGVVVRVNPPKSQLTRKINAAGLAIIKQYESCSLTAYRCPANVLTIGWGHTTDVTAQMKISQAQADFLLEQDLARFERDVQSLVKVPLTDNEFSALVCLAYNIGSDIDLDDIPEGLGDSTLLKLLNQGDRALAAAQFLAWNKSKGVVLEGLTNRRKAEKELFEK